MKKKIKNVLKFFFYLFSRIGVNFIKFKNILYLPRYILDLLKFYQKKGRVNSLDIVLGEHKNSLDNQKIDKHYFLQDLKVAKKIYANNPIKHVDIGSRLDGFIAHVATFRELEMFDLRHLNINDENIKFSKLDLSNFSDKYVNYTDSLSCLHTIEHIGLGRYGDTLNPKGHIEAYLNLIKILKLQGQLYVSVPISKEDKVVFNAHRSFSPLSLLDWSKKVELISFDFINDDGKYIENAKINSLDFSGLEYGCGIYHLKKINN